MSKSRNPKGYNWVMIGIFAFVGFGLGSGMGMALLLPFMSHSAAGNVMSHQWDPEVPVGLSGLLLSVYAWCWQLVGIAGGFLSYRLAFPLQRPHIYLDQAAFNALMDLVPAIPAGAWRVRLDYHLFGIFSGPTLTFSANTMLMGRQTLVELEAHAVDGRWSVIYAILNGEQACPSPSGYQFESTALKVRPIIERMKSEADEGIRRGKVGHHIRVRCKVLGELLREIEAFERRQQTR